MKRLLGVRVLKTPIFWAGILLLAACAWLLLPSNRAQSSSLGQSGLPAEGWQVCGNLPDLDLGSGLGFRQQFLLCSAEGWEVTAYCLDPGMDPPGESAMCSRISDTEFWCGEGVQSLNLYQIQVTPPPPTDIPPTLTFTPSPTPTVTTPPTAIPPAQVSSPTPTVPGVPPGPDIGPSPTPTVYYRPTPGGPTNLVPLLSLLGVTAGLGLLAAAWLTARRS